MTVSEDFIPVEEGQDIESGPTYPTAFGITLTPLVSGILAGSLGLAGALYLLLNMVMPAWDNYQQLQAKRDDLQAQIDSKKASIKQIGKVKADLAQAQQQRADVYTLFANEKTLDTLVLDLNRLVESGNAKLQRDDVRAKLKRFAPANQTADVIADGSLGSEVNGKLKSRLVNVDVEGTYEQTQSIIRNIERLQPLLIVKNYQSTLAPAPPPDPQGKVVRGGPATISTSFQLQALIPANPEQQAAAAAQPKK